MGKRSDLLPSPFFPVSQEVCSSALAALARSAGCAGPAGVSSVCVTGERAFILLGVTAFAQTAKKQAKGI